MNAVLVAIDSRYDPNHHMWRGLYSTQPLRASGVTIDGQPVMGRLWTSAGLNCTREGAERLAQQVSDWALCRAGEGRG